MTTPVHPPSTPETWWVLTRSFFPPARHVTWAVDPARAFSEALRHRMAPRIAARCGKESLQRELGPEIAARFVGASRRAASQAVRAEGLVTHLVGLAADLGCSFAVLKGGALHLQRVVAAGGRPLSDVDILMPHADAEALQALLVRQGWVTHSRRRTEHHLPAIQHPRWMTLEIHDYVPRLTLNGKRWATFSELEATGNLRPLGRLGGCVLVPAPGVLAAHALGGSRSPVLSSLGDLLDLNTWARGSSDTCDFPSKWVATALAESAVEEVKALVSAWGALDPEAAGDANTVAMQQLFDRTAHVFMIERPNAYFAQFLPRAGSPTAVRSAFRRFASRVFSSHAELDARYGHPRFKLGYVILHVRRWLEVLRKEMASHRAAKAS